eukprot:symbB.v1.2.038764.t1/scaffold6164.1/size20404/2
MMPMASAPAEAEDMEKMPIPPEAKSSPAPETNPDEILTHLRGLKKAMGQLPAALEEQYQTLEAQAKDRMLSHGHINKLGRLQKQLTSLSTRIAQMDKDWKGFAEKVLSKFSQHQKMYRQSRASLMEDFLKKSQEIQEAKQEVQQASLTLFNAQTPPPPPPIEELDAAEVMEEALREDVYMDMEEVEDTEEVLSKSIDPQDLVQFVDAGPVWIQNKRVRFNDQPDIIIIDEGASDDNFIQADAVNVATESVVSNHSWDTYELPDGSPDHGTQEFSNFDLFWGELQDTWTHVARWFSEDPQEIDAVMQYFPMLDDTHHQESLLSWGVEGADNHEDVVEHDTITSGISVSFSNWQAVVRCCSDFHLSAEGLPIITFGLRHIGLGRRDDSAMSLDPPHLCQLIRSLWADSVQQGETLDVHLVWPQPRFLLSAPHALVLIIEVITDPPVFPDQPVLMLTSDSFGNILASPQATYVSWPVIRSDLLLKEFHHREWCVPKGFRERQLFCSGQEVQINGAHDDAVVVNKGSLCQFILGELPDHILQATAWFPNYERFAKTAMIEHIHGKGEFVIRLHGVGRRSRLIVFPYRDILHPNDLWLQLVGNRLDCGIDVLNFLFLSTLKMPLEPEAHSGCRVALLNGSVIDPSTYDHIILRHGDCITVLLQEGVPPSIDESPVAESAGPIGANFVGQELANFPAPQNRSSEQPHDSQSQHWSLAPDDILRKVLTSTGEEVCEGEAPCPGDLWCADPEPTSDWDGLQNWRVFQRWLAKQHAPWLRFSRLKSRMKRESPRCCDAKPTNQPIRSKVQLELCHVLPHGETPHEAIGTTDSLHSCLQSLFQVWTTQWQPIPDGVVVHPNTALALWDQAPFDQLTERCFFLYVDGSAHTKGAGWSVILVVTGLDTRGHMRSCLLGTLHGKVTCNELDRSWLGAQYGDNIDAEIQAATIALAWLVANHDSLQGQPVFLCPDLQYSEGLIEFLPLLFGGLVCI